MMKENISPPIPLPSYHIKRTNSELQLAHLTLVADYQEDLMYERILIGILRRCEKTGPCHPKTSSSLENIVNTKMQDFRSLSGRGTTDAGDDWVVGDHSQPMHRSLPAEKELSRHTPSFTSLTSSEIERRNDSMSSLSCSASQTDDSEEATHDIESGIFELEL